MLESDSGYGDDLAERVPSLPTQDHRTPNASLAVRRRIEEMRELKRLRELLDDPTFNENL